MADVTIDGLPAAAQANDSDNLAANQSGVSRRVTRAQILTGVVRNNEIESTASGGAAGPSFSLYRNRIPVAEDLLGEIVLHGKDTGSAKKVYGRIQGQVSDPAAGTLDGRLLLVIPVGSVEKEVFRIGGGYHAWLRSFNSSSDFGPDWTLHRDSNSPADGDGGGRLRFRGNHSGLSHADYVTIQAIFQTVTSGAEDAHLQFSALRAGAKIDSLSPGILYTPIATTSGTSHTHSSIPANARELVVTLANVSTDGVGAIRLRLGTTAGMVTTGYTGVRASIDGATSASDNITGGAFVNTASTAARAYSGQMRFTLIDPATNTWIFEGLFSVDAAAAAAPIYHCAGSIVLPGMADRVELSNADGDAFDAGKYGLLVK